MIDIKDLIKNKNVYLKNFESRGINLKIDVDNAIIIYNNYLSLLKEEEKLRKELNDFSKKNINSNFDEEKRLKFKLISKKVNQLNVEITKLKQDLDEIISTFPNLINSNIPIGKNEEENIFISKHNDFIDNKYSKPHWEIINEKKLTLDFESSNLSGSRHVIYNDKAVLIIKALERLMLDNAIENGFIVVEPPVIVNKNILYNTGQLPKFEDDLYKVNDNQFLIPTAEASLINLANNKLFKRENLPLKYAAGTSCFRKESGSAGKDTRGIIRLHQFRKVELVIVGEQNKEEEYFNLILNTATKVLDKLGLHYQLIQLCTGDTPITSKKTIDIEVWMPGVKKYREISSISYVGDFQSRRMKSRYADENGKKVFTNTFNGSGLAIDRTFAAIIESFINENGDIKLPNILKKYLNFENI